MKRCPICGRSDFQIVGVGQPEPTHHQLRCPCGLFSKLFESKEKLETWWETRGGRAPKKAATIPAPPEAAAPPF